MLDAARPLQCDLQRHHKQDGRDPEAEPGQQEDVEPEDNERDQHQPVVRRGAGGRGGRLGTAGHVQGPHGAEIHHDQDGAQQSEQRENDARIERRPDRDDRGRR